MPLPEIRILNTLSGKKEVFKPLHEGVVSLYLCGPTVYGYTHVGNARAAITGDLVARVFRYAGYQIDFARNITDIDDKIIKVAQETKQSHAEVSKFYTKAYLDEMREIDNLNPNHLPLATEHIHPMVQLIEGLIAKQLAYEAETPYGKDVYFRVRKFENYGKLSKRKMDDMLAGARIEPGEAKEDPLDFALWKAAKPGEPSWESPWGLGRPGWHIECSAMIHTAFPNGLDIHMGGMDLVFPHHENEIAQSEGYSDRPLARYWIHNGLLTLGREKMSKSLGNIFSTRKFLELYGAETLRLLILQNHYRSPSDFAEEVILRTEALLERLYTAKRHSIEATSTLMNAAPASHEELGELADLKAQFDAALFDDFGSAKGLGIILKMARRCFREQKPALWQAWGQILEPLNQSLGLLSGDPSQKLSEIRSRRLSRLGVTQDFCEKIDQRLLEREELRAQKKFEEADQIRISLEAEGILVMDGPDGTAWSVSRKT